MKILIRSNDYGHGYYAADGKPLFFHKSGDNRAETHRLLVAHGMTSTYHGEELSYDEMERDFA